MSQQTAFRLKPDVIQMLSELQALTGKNKTLLLHRALRYYHRAFKAGLIDCNTEKQGCYTAKNTEMPVKKQIETPEVAKI